MKNNKTAPTTAIADGDVMDYATYQAALADVYLTEVPPGYAPLSKLTPPGTVVGGSWFRNCMYGWVANGAVRRLTLRSNRSVYHIKDTLNALKKRVTERSCRRRP